MLWHELLRQHLLIPQLLFERMKQSFRQKVSSSFVPALGLQLLVLES